MNSQRIPITYLFSCGHTVAIEEGKSRASQPGKIQSRRESYARQLCHDCHSQKIKAEENQKIEELSESASRVIKRIEHWDFGDKNSNPVSLLVLLDWIEENEPNVRENLRLRNFNPLMTDTDFFLNDLRRLLDQMLRRVVFK